MQAREKNIHAIQRLTALWGLCESGLGGWMHAMKLPMTGFVVGGFAVMVIGMLAWYSGNNYRTILQSTMLVILVKAVASPHSPFPAYIAVGFQGMMGALLFGLIPNFTLAAILFGVIAMLESAWQMVLMLTLVYGKSLFEAFNAFFGSFGKDFKVSPSTIALSIYTGIYTVWGVILGIWISKLPKNIAQQSKAILEQFSSFYSQNSHDIAKSNSKKQKNKLIQLGITLLFIACIFLFSHNFSKALYAVLRTIAALLLLFLVIGPLFKYLLMKWLERKNKEQSAEIQSIINILPELKSYLKPAWQMAGTGNTGLAKYRHFMLILFIITLSGTAQDG